MSLLYSFAVNTIWSYASLFFDLKASGLDNIPRNEGFLLTANHISYFDPFLVAKYIPGYVHYLAMEEFFANPVSSFLMRHWKSIPIRRSSADRTALREAIAILDHNGIVGVFPEGGIETGEKLLGFQTGAAMLAFHSGKLILPVHIEGTRNLYRPNIFKRKKVHIQFNKPFKLDVTHHADKKQMRHEAIQCIERHINALEK